MTKTLIMLIGPQGAGKSFYCKNTLKAVEPDKAKPNSIVRISQDDQGKTEHFKNFLFALNQGHSVVVDRINHLREQRRKYTENARKARYKIKYVWFDVDKANCLERLLKREDHPTIKQSANHERILSIYFREFEKPEYYEYDEIETITKHKYANILDLRNIIGTEKFIVVGDIHGCCDEFLALLKKCNYAESDFVISVGDLVDRGPNSRGTLEWFRTNPRAYSVEGNHDNKLRRYLSGKRVKIGGGLQETIDQCKPEEYEMLAQWLSSWPNIIRLPDILSRPTYVVHGGVNGKYPIDHQTVETCLYARYFGGSSFLDSSGDIWYSTLDGSYNVISGHMVQEYARLPEHDHLFLLDGGAFSGGTLRGLVVENGTWRIEEVDSPAYVNRESYCSAEGLKSIEHIRARDELVDQKLLRCDDKGDLRIYTYTDECVFAGSWNEITLHSRGIILNRATGEVVARPFSKFFNLGEKVETMESNLPWDEPYLVFEKMDGWLGTLYRYYGQYHVATRGSFDGDGVAIWATEHLNNGRDLSSLPDEVTLVFEILSPKTHIIVEYGDREDLVLLAAFNRHTGEEYDWEQVCAWAKQYNFNLPRVFGSDIEGCRKLLEKYTGREIEGFVIRFANGLRVKIKSEDYKRRAAIVSNLTPLAIWKAMEEGKINDDYRNCIDADYREKYDYLVNALSNQYQILLDEIKDDFVYVNEDWHVKGDRKKFAMRVNALGLRHRGAMFAMLDGKQNVVVRYIMKSIRPTSNVLLV
jgi:RNA ligase